MRTPKRGQNIFVTQPMLEAIPTYWMQLLRFIGLYKSAFAACWWSFDESWGWGEANAVDWAAIARRKAGGQKRFAVENVFAEDILFQQIFQLDDVTNKIKISGVRRRSTSLIHENSKGTLCSLESTVLPTSDVTNKIRKILRLKSKTETNSNIDERIMLINLIFQQ